MDFEDCFKLGYGSSEPNFEALKRLDSNAKENFAGHLQAMIRLICSNEVGVRIKSFAAREISRQLSSSSKFIRDMKKEKWLKIEESIRESMKGTIFNALIESPQESIAKAVIEIANNILLLESRKDFGFGWQKILELLDEPNLNIETRIELYGFLGNLFPSNIDLDQEKLNPLSKVFESDLNLVIGFEGKDIVKLHTRILNVYTKLIESWDDPAKYSKKYSFATAVLLRFEKTNVLKSTDASVCVSAIKLLIGIVMLKPSVYTDKKFKPDVQTTKDLWKEFLENKSTEFDWIQMQFEDNSEVISAIKYFFEKLDSQ